MLLIFIAIDIEVTQLVRSLMTLPVSDFPNIEEITVDKAPADVVMQL